MNLLVKSLWLQNRTRLFFRLYPITFATSRFIAQDLELGGYYVPAGVSTQPDFLPKLAVTAERVGSLKTGILILLTSRCLSFKSFLNPPSTSCKKHNRTVLNPF